MEEYDQDKELGGSQPERYTPLFSTSNISSNVPPSTSRYRQGPPGPPSSARPLGNDADTGSNYDPESTSTFPCNATDMSASQLHYATDYDAAAATRQQQATGFGGYGTSMLMYNVPQANAPTSLYNPSAYMSTLPSRNSQMQPMSFLSTQSGVDQSYFRTEVTGVPETSVVGQHPSNSSAPSDSTYFQTIPSSIRYPGDDGGEGGSVSARASGLTGVGSLYQVAEPGAGSVSTSGPAVQGAASQTVGFEEEWHEYQRRLSNVFQGITVGSLEQAADDLMSVSFWLLSRVEELGLTDDDERFYSERLKLWEDFNNAWLALVFKQKQNMLGELAAAQIPPQPLSRRTVRRLGDELVRLCDGIERFGLVDYQLGVWEDEIESLLEECLNLFDEHDGADDSDATQTR